MDLNVHKLLAANITLENVTTNFLPNSMQATPETLILSSVNENGSNVTHNHATNSSSESLSFILIPLIIVLGVALISGLTIYCIQRRNRLDNLRHTLIPLYTFKAADEDDWGVLLDNCNDNNGRTEYRNYHTNR